MVLIDVSNLCKTFKIPYGEDIEVLKGISLQVKRGEFITIMGPSGSGKSTLLNILASIEEPTKGRILIDELSLDSKSNLIQMRREKTSIVFQDFNLLTYLTALENVMFPMMLTGLPQEEARERATELLKKVGLDHRADHNPDDLSGGEQQRVAIARALSNHPSILLADEPTGNLDSKTGDEIIKLFRNIVQNDKISVIMVTHDIRNAKKTDRILILREGKLFKEEDILEEI